MFGQRPKVRIRPELDDKELRRTIVDTRPGPQQHGLGAGTHGVWQPVADLLRATGRDWDRRVHRILVLAGTLPVATADGWVACRPRDPDALIVRACVRAARASEPVSASRAQELCAGAAEVHPEDPTPWIALLSLLRIMRVPVRHAWPVWTEIVARDPWNRSAHHQLLRYLSPREGGSLIDMTEFARRGAADAPPGSPLVLLPLAARTEHFGHRLRPGSPDSLGVGVHWHGPGVAEEIDTALTRWFHTAAPPHAQAMADLNILAFALVHARRLPDAAKAFRRIGPHMTMFPWELVPDPIGTFRSWSTRSPAGRGC